MEESIYKKVELGFDSRSEVCFSLISNDASVLFSGKEKVGEEASENGVFCVFAKKHKDVFFSFKLQIFYLFSFSTA